MCGREGEVKGVVRGLLRKEPLFEKCGRKRLDFLTHV